ncbi:MAG: hypothetical protein NT001_01835 [Candidatus Woesearchaeota archaeon]|nr:hypothetical protein [Candidatus Woesearchaeota archaeon]
MSSEKISGDISDKTIIVLFIITLLVSSIGTFLVVKSINEAKLEKDNNAAYGKVNGGAGVSMNIERPIGAGTIQMDIQKNKNG